MGELLDDKTIFAFGFTFIFYMIMLYKCGRTNCCLMIQVALLGFIAILVMSFPYFIMKMIIKNINEPKY